MQRMEALKIPSLAKTMSATAPETANAIRSAVTGALTHNENGLFCFERIVETTFVLPWDLNPLVEPEKISVKVRDGIRNELVDLESVHHLEASRIINWNSLVIWQLKATDSNWSPVDNHLLSSQLEKLYYSSASQATVPVAVGQFQIDLIVKKLFNPMTNVLLECRRLAFSPLMTMKDQPETYICNGLQCKIRSWKTERDQVSLFHAASLGFWGIHDRTSLLQNAVNFTLTDGKAQLTFYNRWYSEYRQSAPSSPTKGFPQWEQAKLNIKGAPQLHIFTLANIVQRPILVYTQPDSPVGGIYLPLLWCGQDGRYPSEIHPALRNPLALAYNVTSNHFSPLVTFRGPKGPSPVLLPLTHVDGKLFKIHYLNEKEAQLDVTELLLKFLSVDFINDVHLNVSILTAVMDIPELPDVIDSLVKTYQSKFL